MKFERMTILRFILSAAFVLAATAEADSKQPNIVLIISDDHAWTDYGFAGHPHAKTPNIDRLAAEGLTFTRGYVTTAICSPSLATMLTGLYPHQHGITGNDPHQGQNRADWIDPFFKKPQLPRLLTDAGYMTLHTGKYWMGHPNQVGFTDDMGPTGRHGGKALSIGRKSMKPIYDFIDKAQQQEKPFFVWYAPFLPHTPHNPPERLLKKYAAVKNQKKAKYLAMIEWLDETCGELMSQLKKKGVADNTLVLYLPENGEKHHSIGTEAPFLVLAGENVKLSMARRRYIRLPNYDEEGHKTLGNWYTTILNAYGNPIEHYGDLDVSLKIDQEGAIQHFLS